MNNSSVKILTPIWTDERKWCKYARNDDIDGGNRCPMLCNQPNQRPYCRLNGNERKSPCAFDEPDEAMIWQEINQSVAEYKARGWV